MSDAAARRRVLRASAIVAAYLATWASWQALGWGGPGMKHVIGDLFVIVFNGSAAFTVWTVARRCAGTRVGPAWRLLAIGLSFYWAGGLMQGYYELVPAAKPYPSLAEPLFLMFYPFAFAALLRFPRARESRLQRLHTLIDCATVATAGSAVVWYVLLGPATLVGGTLLQSLATIAYPVGDLILIAALATAVLRRALPETAGVLRIAALGFVVFVASDLVYGTLSLKGAYSGGHPADGLCMLSVGLMAVAARAQRGPVEVEPEDEVATRRASWLPWLGVALVFALLATAARHDAFVPIGGLLASAATVTFLAALRQLAAQRELLSTHRELELAHAELAALAVTDPVTLMPNHRAMVTAIDKELARCKRTGASCAVAFVDIDHFKAFNDNFGHAAGDAALREFGAVARTALRNHDMIGRWGGEEFVALLPEVDGGGAMAAAERLRNAVAGHRLRAAQGVRITCSIGFAVFPDDGDLRADLIDAADSAMYTAKRLGRNRTLSAGDPVVTAIGAEPTGHDSRRDDALTGAVSALTMLVDARDVSTDAHASAVADLAGPIAVELGCCADEVATIHTAARLHDIGKIVIPESVLSKPGPLTEGEWTLIRTHPVIGAEVLARVPALRAIAPLARSHHERWDGTGYPDGLRGEEIPLGARVIAVADAFDAMVSERPYSKAMTPEAALAELRACAGTQFDEQVVEAMGRTLQTTRASREPAVV